MTTDKDKDKDFWDKHIGIDLTPLKFDEKNHTLMNDDELRAFMKQIREKDVTENFLMLGTPSPELKNQMMVCIVIPDNIFPKRTGWLETGEYGIHHYSDSGIVNMHYYLHMIFQNDETSEKHDFFWSICPLACLADEDYTRIVLHIAISLGTNFGDRPGTMMFASNTLHKMFQRAPGKHVQVLQRMYKDKQFAKWIDEHLVIAKGIHMKTLGLYVTTVMDGTRRLPITETFLKRMMMTPCKTCEKAIKLLRQQNKIATNEEFSKVIPPDMQKRITDMLLDWQEQGLKDRK